MKLVQLKGEVFVNPQYVVSVCRGDARYHDKEDNKVDLITRITLTSGSIEVEENLFEVVDKLRGEPVTVELPNLPPGRKVTITSHTDEDVIVKAPSNVTYSTD